MIIFSSCACFSYFTNYLHCLFYYGFFNENVSPLKISVFWVLFEIWKPCSYSFSCIMNFRNAKRRIITPIMRVCSLIEFLLDSAKRQNYAVCMCVCRFYIYLPPLSSLSYRHKPTSSYYTTEPIFFQGSSSICRTHYERSHILITYAPAWLQFYGAIHTHRYTSSLR